MKLSEEQVKQFRKDGVLVVDYVLTDEDVLPVIAEYEAWILQPGCHTSGRGKKFKTCARTNPLKPALPGSTNSVLR